MKRLGIILIIIGLVLTLVTGFKFFTKEKVVDLGNVEVNRNEAHKVNWSPYVGIGIIVVGGIMVIVSRRNTV
jgi:uncharacterized membrane protein YidH (DUF202 family)